MKKVLFLASLCYALTLSAQKADYPKQESLQVVDNMQLRVQYDVDWRYDLEKPGKVMHDKMYTEIGQNVCHSYIEREWNNEVKFNKGYENNGKRGSNAIMALYSNIGEVFVGYPKGKITSIYSLDALGTYKYDEPAVKLEWSITDEKLDTLDYHCKVATCTYAGREYKAWFTEEIPVGFGPWKLGGLPGLIIKAVTTDGDYRFVLAGIEKVKDARNISIWNRDFILSTKQKTRKQEKILLTQPGELLEQIGMSFTVVTYDSNTPAKLKFFTFDNPLEKQ